MMGQPIQRNPKLGLCNNGVSVVVLQTREERAEKVLSHASKWTQDMEKITQEKAKVLGCLKTKSS